MLKNFFQILAATVLLSSVNSCLYFDAKKKDIIEDDVFYISKNSDFNAVLDSLSPKMSDLEAFKLVAESKSYPQNVKPGKYKLDKNWTNEELINKLMSGDQIDQAIMIGNWPTIYHLAGRVAKKLDTDSADIVQAIQEWASRKDSTLNDETVKMYFVPNTYNFVWTSTGEEFVNRMVGEFDKVWNEERKAKAKAMNFTPLQVYTLASVVQMEAADAEEQRLVAQAYLNRLKKGMKLEADPTSVYAYKLEHGFNKQIRRVLNKHLATPSAYNTYKVTGLPPAPICLPNTTAVDAVLNPEEHPFVFFCADPDRPGKHSFTNSYAEHQKNAAKYRNWLKEKGIR